MRNSWRALGLASGLAIAATSVASPATEAALDAGISAADQMAWMKQMSAKPIHVGAPHNKANADFTLAKFREWGWDAKIETFDILYPTPVATAVELVAPTRIVLGGQEPAVAGDATSQDMKDALPPYVAYQGDGDVTAPLVYANYGMPEDFADLARRGIDVRGKIVIARYGAGWRGLKPKLAQEAGAVGCIIYSDPGDDGYGGGDPYPKGGTRPPAGVQRGAVVDMTSYPGDPLTPFVGSTKGAKRLTRETAPTILKIPVLPMSYGDAQQLLGRLEGPLAPKKWIGQLPIAYHIGGTDTVKVRLMVKSDWKLTPIHNVIATLKGRTAPDEWVIRGNHRDGWVFGASDPLSGHVAMMSEAKALGGMLKQGWRPARTIVYASWDAEEPGLIGSTEWAEAHAAELKRKALIYINTDLSARGILNAEGSHAWQHLVNAVAADVTDPQTSTSVASRWRAKIVADAFEKTGNTDPAIVAAAQAGRDIPLRPLGSGSDYSPFIQHLGIPALHIYFGGENEVDGVYHSAYDSFDHFTRFDDPGLAYGAVLSKTIGRVVLRIADAATPPARYGDFAATVARYTGEVKALAAERRTRDATLTKLIADKSFTLASNPSRAVAAPAGVEATPAIDFAALDAAVARLTASATAFDTAHAASAPTAAQRTRLNAALRDIDQLLTDNRGLPGRPWFRNMVYAPGRFTGYGAKTLPGIREAIEERRFADAATYVTLTAGVLDAYAKRLDTATAIVGGK